MKAAVIEHGQEIKMVDIEQDGSGSYLSALQSLVGGNVEAIDALYGDSPLLWVNEEGILSALTPSRALYTNKRMENLGYLSRDGDHVVKDGELYAIIFRTAVAWSYEVNDEGERSMRDISTDELSRLKEVFMIKGSGMEEALRIKLGVFVCTR